MEGTQDSGTAAGPREQEIAVYGRLLAAGEILVCELDATGRFIKVNPAMARVLGLQPAAVQARRYLEFVHSEDQEATAAARRRSSPPTRSTSA